MDGGYTINDLVVGQRASFAKTITESDVYSFAGVTGDLNTLSSTLTSARRKVSTCTQC